MKSEDPDLRRAALVFTEQAMRCAPPAWRLSGPQVFVIPSEGSEGSELRMVRAQFQIPHPSQSNFIFLGHIMLDSVVIRWERIEVLLEVVVKYKFIFYSYSLLRDYDSYSIVL